MTLGKMILKRNRAVSPVIATVLLIALTVTAAAVIYVVVSRLMQPKPEFVVINAGRVTGYPDRYQIKIANEGSGTGSIDALTYIKLSHLTDTDISPVAMYVGTTPYQNYTLAVGGEVTLILDFDTDFVSGDLYIITFSYNSKTLEYQFNY
ncbi:MAG: type IV pilin [Asgard group archaeon]|nr:type IV pilin [Asgard group archaeon]